MSTQEITHSENLEIWIRHESTINPKPLPLAWIPVPFTDILSINVDSIQFEPRVLRLEINTLYQQLAVSLTRYIDSILLNRRDIIERESKQLTKTVLTNIFSIGINEEENTLEFTADTNTLYKTINPKIDELFSGFIIRGIIDITVGADPQQLIASISSFGARLGISEIERRIKGIIDTVRLLLTQVRVHDLSLNILNTFKKDDIIINDTVIKITVRLARLQRGIDLISVLRDRRSIIDRLSRILDIIKRIQERLEDEIKELTEGIRINDRIEQVASNQLTNLLQRLNEVLNTIRQEYPLLANRLSTSPTTLIILHDEIVLTPSRVLQREGIITRGRGKMRLLSLLEDAINFAQLVQQQRGRILGLRSSRVRREEAISRRVNLINQIITPLTANIRDAINVISTTTIKTTKLVIDSIWRTIVKIIRRVTMRLKVKRYYKVEALVDIQYAKTGGARIIRNEDVKEGRELTPEERIERFLSTGPQKVHEVHIIIPYHKPIFDNQGNIIKEVKEDIDRLIITSIDRAIYEFVQSEGDERAAGLLTYFSKYSQWLIGIKRVWSTKQFNVKTYMLILSLDKFGIQNYSYLTAELSWLLQKTLDNKEIIQLSNLKLIEPWTIEEWDRYIESIEREGEGVEEVKR